MIALHFVCYSIKHLPKVRSLFYPLVMSPMITMWFLSLDGLISSQVY